MKKIIIIILVMNLFTNLIASELVLIETKTNQEIQSLSLIDNLSINYLGNGFVIATVTGKAKEEFKVLDNNAWQSGENYFLIFVNKTKNTSYIFGLTSYSQQLYQTEELTIISVSDQKLNEVLPPVDGSLTRVFNKPAELPSAKISFPESKAEPDPFIVSRLAEVNTTLMQTNLQHLQDYGTRNAYTAQSIQAQNWIKQQFESYGLSTQLFDFTMPGGSASDNVIATKTGTLYPNEYVIIGGHYDSYTGSSSAPGADDNASGTCGVLEIARILAPYSYDRTIIFCAFSGEEYGLYGSAAYATWCDNQNLNILGYLNMDMIGYLKAGDPIHTDIIAPASAQDLVDYYTACVNLYLPTFITGPGMLSGGDSDHTSFNNHGFMGIFPFEDSQDYSPYIHTTSDVIGTSVNNFTQVGVFTKAILATTVSLANMVPPQLVNVTGIVTDQSTGLPLQGATIEVLNETISPVTTNVSGQYTITNILEGIYDFRISKAGYATTYQEVEITIDNLVFNFQLGASAAWSFETGLFETQWTFGGSAPWYITNTGAYDGQYCSRSGAIGDNAFTDMSITLTFSSGGNISFFRKVSSEAGYDYLRFYIDGVQQGLWAGEVAWGDVFYPVTAGTHTMKWSYTKDANTIGGSDASWVDFINFPPYIPLPEPADINIYPMSFSQSLPVNTAIDKQLTISNLGEADLTFTATVEYLADNKALATVYPVNTDYNTGTTTSSSKTYNSLVRAYPPNEAGWMKFDVSSIPDGATINSVEFHGYVNANNWPWWSITPVSNDPVTTVSSTLYSDINAEGTTGYYLFRNESGTLTNGWVTHLLGGNVNANLQAALSQNWFAIGFMERDANTYHIGFDGWNQANKPYLVIDYTYVPTYSWLQVNGSNSATGTVTGGTNQNLTLSFNSTGLSLGVYNANIKIASNDMDEPLLTVPCVLNVINQFSLDLTILLEGPFSGTEMNTSLNIIGFLPLNQPYNTVPWSYDGTENVSVIPNVNVVDWVLVELRDAASANTATAATRVARMAAFLLKDGSVVAMDGTSNLLFTTTISQQLFIVLYHRNHLGVLSANPLSQVGGVYAYSFSSGSGQAYGGASSQKQVGEGIWAMFGGDGDHNGKIEEADKILEWQIEAGTEGFKYEDYNMDGQVNNQDKDDFWLPNLGNETAIPE